MTLRERLRVTAQAELQRLTDRLAEQTPRQDVRPSITAPTPEQATEALRRCRYKQRLGHPDLHLGDGPPQNRPYLV
jgi:hypothetical protein